MLKSKKSSLVYQPLSHKKYIFKRSSYLSVIFLSASILASSPSQAVYEEELRDLIDAFESKPVAQNQKVAEEVGPNKSPLTPKKKGVGKRIGDLWRYGGQQLIESGAVFKNKYFTLPGKVAGAVVRTAGQGLAGETKTLEREILNFWVQKGSPKKITQASACISTSCAIYLSKYFDEVEEEIATYRGFIEKWNNSCKISWDSSKNISSEDATKYFAHGLIRGMVLKQEPGMENENALKDVLSPFIFYLTGNMNLELDLKSIYNMEKANRSNVLRKKEANKTSNQQTQQEQLIQEKVEGENAGAPKEKGIDPSS